MPQFFPKSPKTLPSFGTLIVMRKVDILNLLVRTPELDAATIAVRLEASPEATRMLLLRLTRQGLVRREFDPDQGVFFYSATPKGKQRWSYLVPSTHNTMR